MADHQDNHEPILGDHEKRDEQTTYPHANNPENEQTMFKYLLEPDDSYTSSGIYWADLPISKRVSFIMSSQAAETSKELGTIVSMLKADPLSPLAWYFRNAVLPGAGIGLEGYVIFAIGNLTTLFDAVWPSCWSKYETCTQNWIAAVTYMEIIGIILGQFVVGLLGDGLGRRWALVQDALIMLLGLIMLIASWGTTLQGWVICYAFALLVYGFGVGGEYPTTATTAVENAVSTGRISTREDRLHRGRKVTMAFTMQGWGQFLNQAALCILLLIFHHGVGKPPYSEVSAQWTFRISFVIPAVATLWLAYYRWYKMPLAGRQLNAAKRREGITGYDYQSLKLTLTHFGPRLLATAGGWFCNDVFFYGNKLYSSTFIKVVDPASSTSVQTSWIWSLINCVVELAGYYCASLLVDNKLYGRKTMQQVGFFVCFLMFVIPAFNYDHYSSKAGIHSFQAMFFISSFFNQFGPNSITFLVAAEVYPTPIRASAHGFSAAVGKLGALMATILYNYITTQQRFYVVPWFGLAGMLITFLFLPDTTGLDLKEQERRWAYIRAGRSAEYHGVAVHPHHLSLWERLMGQGKAYNSDLDRQSRIDEMRIEWEARQSKEELGDESAVFDDGEYTSDVQNYFSATGNASRAKAPQTSSAGDSDEISNEKPAL